jgi:hypothetical protein
MPLGQLVSRFAGTMISDFWTNKKCISEGKAAGDYFKQGKCSGTLVSMFLDSKL